MAFTHLHVHTEYSLLDGAARIDRLMERAKELGMSSMAITDHGVMFGAVQFFETMKKNGIKPVIGCEVYTASRTRFDKDATLDRNQGHLILLVKNDEGYRNLIKMVSLAYSEGFYYKPRVDHELLSRYSEGLICLSACLAGKVQHELLRDNYEGAKEEALFLLDTFGEGNFYLEIQDQGLEEEYKINPMLKKLSKEINVPLVATNDVHYINQSDASAHDVLLCIQTKSNLSDPDRMRFANDQFYLKSEKEMRNIFADIPEACDITQEIVDKCNFEFEFGKYHIPVFPVPEGFTQNGYFEHLCWEGLKKRYGEEPPQELKDRMQYEIDTIEKLGYVGYHLIVWDFINYAKRNGIMVGPGRGSAAGSIVCYSLEITDIDPMRFNLIFERFLNVERVSMPDIDVDFCVARRGEVIDYVKRRYGENNVAQISTFGTLKAKACFKDVAKVMEIPFARSLEVSKMIPNDLKITLSEALEKSPDLKKVYEEDAQIAQAIDTAKVLEGLARHVSTHAAGVVISKDPVDTYVPLVASDKGLATQFTMTEIEHLGLLKMDFLGLRNLTAIRDCLALIKEDRGEEIDLHAIDYADPEVFRLIASGNTTGIFQLESGGMTGFMKRLRPDCLEDLIAGISLYRPGPMDSIPAYVEAKNNTSKIKYLVPELEPILAPTYGCIVYQEQVMEIVRKLGGYSYGRSDLVRRAMSKKKADVMAMEREFFINGKLNDDGTIDVPGCIRNGIPEAAANQIFDEMTSFAAYAFNKSHAAAYAVVAYQTAWLKCHYTAEFLASLMTNPADGDAVANLIRNANEMGIEVLPPDVLRSRKDFSTENGKIRFGLLGVKHVGEGVADEIVEKTRKAHPTDMFEFIDCLDPRNVNRTALEALIKAGALDCFPGNRAQKLVSVGTLLESAAQTAKENLSGQMSLFSMEEMRDTVKIERTLPPAGDLGKRDLLMMEKEMLGVFLTGHPLDDYRDRIEEIVTMDTRRLKEAVSPAEDDEEDEEGEGSENVSRDPDIADGKNVVMAGLVLAKKSTVTKKGDLMAYVTIEDLYGSVEVVVFPRTFELDRGNIVEDSVVVFKGKLDLKQEGTFKVIADRIIPIDEYKGKIKSSKQAGEELAAKAKADDMAMIKIVIPADIGEREGLLLYRQIARRFRGEMPVAIKTMATGSKFRLDYDLWVEPSDEFRAAVLDVFGEGSLLE